MAHPAYLRDKARSLRVEKRLTIYELAQRLALPRTTIFYWVRDLPPLPSKQTVPQELGNRKMQVNYRRLREEGESIRFQRKSNSGQLRGRTWRSQYGVLCITVYDTLVRARLQGWIDSAREEWTRLGT